jgi:hypothetical protein
MTQNGRQDIDPVAQPEVSPFDDEATDGAYEPSRKERAGLGHVMRTPAVGATVTGAVVLGAAAAFGVLEAAVAAGAAYATYLVLRKKTTSQP